MRIKQKRLICFALPLVAMVFCRPASDAESREKQEKDRIEEYWNAKMAEVQKAVDRDQPVSLEEFGKAVEFFERVTRIDSHTMTYVGRYPEDGFDEILEQYKAWYADNKGRLYWDDRGQTVRSKDQTESERVDEFWNERIQVVLDAASWAREKANPEEFAEAVEFFEKITGIQLQVGAEPELAETVESWFAWYAENKERLSWDESAQTVRLKKKE